MNPSSSSSVNPGREYLSEFDPNVVAQLSDDFFTLPTNEQILLLRLPSHLQKSDQEKRSDPVLDNTLKPLQPIKRKYDKIFGEHKGEGKELFEETEKRKATIEYKKETLETLRADLLQIRQAVEQQESEVHKATFEYNDAVEDYKRWEVKYKNHQKDFEAQRFYLQCPNPAELPLAKGLSNDLFTILGAKTELELSKLYGSSGIQGLLHFSENMGLLHSQVFANLPWNCDMFTVQFGSGATILTSKRMKPDGGYESFLTQAKRLLVYNGQISCLAGIPPTPQSSSTSRKRSSQGLSLFSDSKRCRADPNYSQTQSTAKRTLFGPPHSSSSQVGELDNELQLELAEDLQRDSSLGSNGSLEAAQALFLGRSYGTPLANIPEGDNSEVPVAVNLFDSAKPKSHSKDAGDDIIQHRARKWIHEK